MRRKTGKNPAAKGSGGRSDPWQTAVYAFEDTWPEASRDNLPIRWCREIIRLACAAYGLRAPPVKFDPKARESFCYVDGSGITLARTQRNKFVAMHEAAHYISDRVFGRDLEDHGFEFQGIYFFLLTHIEVAPVEALAASVKTHGMLWRITGPNDLF